MEQSQYRFEVLENGLPCSHERYPEGSLLRKGMEVHGWTEYRFATFEEACDHLNHWRGWTGPLEEKYLPDVPYEFYGTVFMIRTLNPLLKGVLKELKF